MSWSHTVRASRLRPTSASHAATYQEFKGKVEDAFTCGFRKVVESGSRVTACSELAGSAYTPRTSGLASGRTRQGLASSRRGHTFRAQRSWRRIERGQSSRADESCPFPHP